MVGSFKLGRIAGIDVKIHWTFFLLLAWVAGSALFNQASSSAALVNVLLVICVFACVLAHEFGHALTARHFGIPTDDITLLPIGGIASLREIPEKPMEELVVAIAGPLVNVVIAFVLVVALFFTNRSFVPTALLDSTSTIGFFQSLTAINIALVVFNLVPAFPMDGGRMLRAILAMRMSRVQATDIAASVGQFLAIGFGFLGLFGNPMLILIAVFVYFGAQAEAAQVRSSSLIANLPVQAAMVNQFTTTYGDRPILEIRDRLLEGAQQDFPVLDHANRPVGMISQAKVFSALRNGMRDAAIQTMMTPIDEVQTKPDDSLRSAMERLQTKNLPALLVVNDNRLVGMLTRENIAELLIFREMDPTFMPPTHGSEFVPDSDIAQTQMH
ncbi:MAG: site-2 protease family protein [Planctomycetales bacterium]|nr:site-2 protease family protein [Planctomycetales bacterium]